jgi:3-isopropylmalate/(R)-2-methylmalate dehydratase large subunit/3-isopropylmalate/(R)-2-methylmalate dehydratase small subunit
MEKGIVTAGGQTFSCTKLPAHLQKILDQGGLISSLDSM